MKILFWMFIGFDRHATSEHLLLAIIERLCEAGHSVKIIQKDTGGNLPSIPVQLEKYDITTDIVPFHAAFKGNFVARYLTELKYVNACRRFITSDYDLVFIQSNNVAGFALNAVRKKLPNAIVTLNIQDIFPYNAAYSGIIKKRSMIFSIMAAEQRYGYKRADHIITISEDMRETLIMDGVPEEKIEVIYNWAYQDEPYDKTYYTLTSGMFDKNFFNVVYAGNIGVMQNVDIIIDAAKLMKDDKDIWFHIIGDGVYKEKLKSKAKEYGIINITFWPMQPPEMAPFIYCTADVNVIPLGKNVYRTALPSKTAICLASNKPVIFAIGKASKFGKQVTEKTNCIVLEPDQPNELVNAIKKEIILKNSNYSYNYFFTHHFSKTRNSKQYAQIIQSK